MVSKLLVIAGVLLVGGVLSLGAASTGLYDTRSCTPAFSGPPICFENPNPEPVYLGMVLVVAGLALVGAALLRDPRKEPYSSSKRKKREGVPSSRAEGPPSSSTEGPSSAGAAPPMKDLEEKKE